MSVSEGDVQKHTATVTEELVQEYAELTGDTNPLHLNESYASDTIFGERIAHGMLAMGFVSAALAKFDGVVIYIGQDVDFEQPIPLGAIITAECVVVEQEESGEYIIETEVFHGRDGTVYLEGVAMVRINEEPDVSE